MACPTGTGGKVVSLISGGIDSPVATYRMLKRGCKAVFVHFHGRPIFITSIRRESTRYRQAPHLVSNAFASSSHAHLEKSKAKLCSTLPHPFASCSTDASCFALPRRSPSRKKPGALVTGESLGQVASQTPENIVVVNQATTLPILRPLIGMDKLEIIQQAQTIGTFETSIEPDQDCCTLFVPKHPQTRCDLPSILKVEEHLDIPALIQQGLEDSELMQFTH